MDAPCELLNIKFPSTFCSIPFGLHLIGNLPKKLILITWNHNTVVTYKFRDISIEFLTKSLDNFNILEPNEVHEIKNFLEPNEMIANVYDTLVNTFLLTSFGRLFVFVSTKTIRQLNLSATTSKIRVKNLGYTTNGIYLIENRNGTELFIKFYRNEWIQNENFVVASIEPVEFNLNIEDNLKFNISRLDEAACINVFKFDEILRNILEGLIGTKIDDDGSIAYSDVVLFSIESNLFWLNTQSGENLIQPLNVSSSKIINFIYSKAQHFIICLLESGVVEILYYLTKFKMISKYYHTLGTELNCYKLIGSNNLIYSNDRSLVQITFYNDKKDCDGIDIETKTINVFGTQAIAYNELLKQIFVITNNFLLFNLNYNTNYLQLTQNTNSNANMNLYEIKNYSKILFRKSEVIKNLEALKAAEIDKIHLIDLIKQLKSDKTSIGQSNTCRINLIYRQNLLLQFVCTFNVHLQIVEHAKQFKILIELHKFDRTTIHTFDVEHKVTFKKSIEYAIDQRNVNLILPKFKIYLVTKLSMAADSIAYEFPMQLLNNYCDDINRNYFYLNYNRRLDVGGVSKTLPSLYNFRIKNVDFSYDKLLKLLEFEHEEDYCEYLFLNQYKFMLRLVEGLATIEAECPQTLFCVKYYILKKLNPSVEFGPGMVNSVQKLKYALPEEEQITVESQSELQAILHNLRTEFVPIFTIPENT